MICWLVCGQNANGQNTKYFVSILPRPFCCQLLFCPDQRAQIGNDDAVVQQVVGQNHLNLIWDFVRFISNDLEYHLYHFHHHYHPQMTTFLYEHTTDLWSLQNHPYKLSIHPFFLGEDVSDGGQVTMKVNLTIWTNSQLTLR